ncbi:hypothetical protein Kpol_526p9 [Vanderwaltozyma polyspora DSM 70294]|uniref:CCZ1/INTU/HSP4 first Longin domain-containing protein n=1 Tax=Vanderwaltozyma polyspora (strain ATCC 22028 / DSM 70294 / BCRC 21397 / CBS 2163 / NBRC 10782 / NRRL Y-8283 / UCD 57-17) TaxID=436907 RepID=A7TLR4_VANPO|nr:uncharacterized protein Kpol_526p9 [Vanderwaltozyma polyspora DSM 70294]EDO16756.1 hypothetical protein Kpol_526p9 [Vanderwaltozyma polyspora DSM 70294]
MLNYIVIFDPSKSLTEDDTYKELILYHSFQNEETSLNDKLGKIGVLQSLWSFTETLNGDSSSIEEKIIELDDEIIIIYKVENQFYLCLSVILQDEMDNILFPHQLYSCHLKYCYEFFILQFGEFNSFTNINQLTDSLNEYLVLFWNDIILKPETMKRKMLNCFYPDSFKVSELQSDKNLDSSWESILNQNILLNTENYLGIRDVLVYHLPSNSGKSNNGTTNNSSSNNFNTKDYGFIRNFATDLDSLPHISNWIHHLHTTYEDISSHTLSGNAHYKETQIENEDSPEITNDDQQNDPLSFTDQTKNFLYNMTLPISFAYDVVQEVGESTGIGNSMSLVMNYIPKFSFSENSTNNKRQLNGQEFSERHGFLISPLANNSLPESYKIKKLRLKFKQYKESKVFNTLFWYMNDTLLVLVFNDDFENIWDREYLKELDSKLYEAISFLYKSINAAKSSVKKVKSEPFAYAVINKDDPGQIKIQTSIPSWFSSINNLNDVNPLQLIVNGVDQLFKNTTDFQTNNNFGLDIMGSLFGYNSKEDEISKNDQEIIKNTNINFLGQMDDEKLWELHLELLQIISNVKISRKLPDLNEERLLKLSNGLLCYVKDNENETMLVIKNWFDINENEKPTKSTNSSTLFGSLGSTVTEWNDKREFNCIN